MRIEHCHEDFGNGRTRFWLKIDGKTRFDVSDGEPEDNCISRKFADVTLIHELLEDAHAAGRRGELLQVVEGQAEAAD